ncbi:bifunctional DNA-formamidopyrimidine glycosylase/DNA-(apurinic or apyrimidinic site) lyase [Candidatus Pelagibacter sp.]|uniref:bifunctional DNA-formamidopyrimidine glycosylase/DNA-(apurinic or apyrimidinic site) lyase n=1 Tax=Candidatus Pelagibacter sp. TaxID=2024849 RepID=UPI003F83F7F5
MPELPEVEVVRQSLAKNVTGKKIKKILVRNRKLRFFLDSSFEKELKNKLVNKISRFSKYLIIELNNKKFCIVHLGMSGTIHIIKNKEELFTNTSFYNSPNLPKKHNHVEFEFSDLKLIYNDPRRFGFFQIIKNQKKLIDRFKLYGPEPFDKNFNLKYVTDYFKDKKKDIKNYLLDQKFVSGIGNIYASEILYLSKINPLTSVNDLSKSQLKKLIINSKKILLNAIKKGGSTIRDFKNTLGISGKFQKEFKVYGREKLKCRRSNCSGIIVKIVQANRSTFLCKICQK